jgi:hypothetical protein
VYLAQVRIANFDGPWETEISTARIGGMPDIPFVAILMKLPDRGASRQAIAMTRMPDSEI